MKTYEELRKYKTDDERLSVLHEVGYVNWGIVADWEDEAQSAESRRIFHSTAVNLYHREEAACGLL